MSRLKSLILASSTLVVAIIAVILWQSHLAGRQELVKADDKTSAETYMKLLSSIDPSESLDAIKDDWQPGSAAMLVEVIRFSRNRKTRDQLMQTLTDKTGQPFGSDLDAWYDWIWKQDYQPHPEYAEFKGQLYSLVDPRFAEYFEHSAGATIRLDEIRWGGVRRDGIPPLKNPQMVAPNEAKWMADSNVVFGVVINGDARCYPKRILAWHEMFKDTIGGQPVCGAY